MPRGIAVFIAVCALPATALAAPTPTPYQQDDFGRYFHIPTTTPRPCG